MVMRTFAFDLSVCFAFLTNHEMSIGHMIAVGNGTSALVIEQSFGEQTSVKELGIKFRRIFASTTLLLDDF